jgi:hypothetical protein
MEYALELLYKEQHRLIELKNTAMCSDAMDSWDWDTIIRVDGIYSHIVNAINILEENDD